MDKIRKAFDLVLIFYLFAGGLYFFYFILQYSKLVYILIAILIYILSLIVRKIILKKEFKSGYTEVGLFLIAFIFLAYFLYIFKLDKDIVDYLPDKVLINSGSVFVIGVLFYLINITILGKNRILGMVLILTLFISAKYYQNNIDRIFLNYPWIASLIIGSPYIYLLSVLFGVDINTRRN